MIIGINGRVGSGKDTVGRVIQYLIRDKQNDGFSSNITLEETLKLTVSDPYHSGWEIKKYAAKLKQIASLLTGIPVEMFEDQDFKKSLLGEEWNQVSPAKKEMIGLKEMTAHLNKGYIVDTATANLGSIQVEGKNKIYIEMEKPEQVLKYTVRGFLQKLGTEGIRDSLHTNAWVNALFADYKQHVQVSPICLNTDTGITSQTSRDLGMPNWIITDCRFPNEAQAIKDRGGIVIRVTRPGENLADLHPSETSLDNWTFDFVLDNSGTIAQLKDNVAFFLHTNKLL